MDKPIKKSKNQSERPKHHADDDNILNGIYTALVNQALLDTDIIITDDIFNVLDDEDEEEDAE
jgi:hypothetical protein